MLQIEALIKERLSTSFLLTTAEIDSTTGLRILAKFDREVFVSDIICVMSDIEGVMNVDLVKLTRQPVAELVLWSGNSLFENVGVGTNSVEEEWEVRFITATTFNVKGSISGPQGSGVIGDTFVSTNGNLTFLITSGTVPQGSGDFATLRTSKFFGNVTIDFNEVSQLGALNLALEEL